VEWPYLAVNKYLFGSFGDFIVHQERRVSLRERRSTTDVLPDHKVAGQVRAAGASDGLSDWVVWG